MTDLHTATTASSPTAERIDALLAELTTEEKVQLLTGRDFWTTWPIEKIGLRRILMSDGPSGVRGEVWDERDPSLNLPSATALSASWDRAIAKRYGAAAAVEARRKGVDVVLGPTINLHRSPLGGRHFEAFSEDPVLTGDLAASYVAGVQENGVAATPKHYIANDYETDRFTASTEVSDRALRELYLLAFEKAVTEAHAWAVMSSYNAINGVTASENDLLETPLSLRVGLRRHRRVRLDRCSLGRLREGVAGRRDARPEPVVERGPAPRRRAVRRRPDRGDRPQGPPHPDPGRPGRRPRGLRARRRAAGARRGRRRVRPRSRGRGHRAGAEHRRAAARRLRGVAHRRDRAQRRPGPHAGRRLGHGRAVPGRVTARRDPLGVPRRHGRPRHRRRRAGGHRGVPAVHHHEPGDGEPGARVAFVKDGEELYVEDRGATALFWFGGDAPTREADRLDITTTYTAESTGTVRIGIGAAGRSRMWIDGALVLDEDVPFDGDQLGAAFLNPPARSVPVSVTSGQQLAIRIEHDVIQDETLGGVLAYQFGTEPSDEDPSVLIDAAVEAARTADIAVVVVGTNSKVESEGYDRSSLALPGHQDDLVRAVAAANPNTVVVVNAGSPVEMPWRNDVAAVLLTWFGGQEYGNALADVLTGAQEPGGRLPTTWPVAMADVPVLDVTPVDGKVSYDEGVHIGYRAWLRAGTEPAYPFGHGLGYTTWTIDGVTATPTVSEGDAVIVTATVANTGARAGKHVVQVYASREVSEVDRPVRWLVGFAPVRLGAGESTEVSIEVPARAFAHWDGSWRYEAGRFTLHVGGSVLDEAGTTGVELG